MNIRVFYSWQSDLPNRSNRGFIEDCIKKAIKKIHNSDKFELLLSLDRDTKSETGTPDIAETIFNKIKSCHIFIGDISIITSNTSDRKSPNPNVLLELGYAAGILGWENIICIYNSATAPVESLPFDLRSRRPVIYHLDETGKDDSTKSDLVGKIEKAIKEIDFNLTAEVKDLKIVFANESDKAKYLVMVKPEYWELQLVEELLRNKMAALSKGYSDLQKGLTFRRKKNVDANEFFEWFSASLETYTQFYNITSKVLNEELKGHYGNDNPKAIKETIDILINSCQGLLDWELDLNSLIVPEETEEILETLRGASVEGFKEIYSLPDKIRSVLKNIDSSTEHTIQLSHAAPMHLSRAGELFTAYFRRISDN